MSGASVPIEAILEQLRSQSRSQQGGNHSMPNLGGQYLPSQEQRQQSPASHYSQSSHQASHQRDLHSPGFTPFAGGLPNLGLPFGHANPGQQLLQQFLNSGTGVAGATGAHQHGHALHGQQHGPSPSLDTLGGQSQKNANLLHLLRGTTSNEMPQFDGSRDLPALARVETPSSSRHSHFEEQTIRARITTNHPDVAGMNAQDLVTSLLGSVVSSDLSSNERRAQIENAMTRDPPRKAETHLDAAQRDLLHSILGRTKPSEDESAAVARAQDNVEVPFEEVDTTEEAQEISKTSRNLTPQSTASLEADPPSTMPTGHTPEPKSIFTYVNPFEQLHASSPRNRTPKPSHPKHVTQTVLMSQVPFGAPSPTPTSIPLPFSPPPPQEGDVGRPRSSLQPEAVIAQLRKSDARHTPPPTHEPYVEEVPDMDNVEQDPFEGAEADPFDDSAAVHQTEEKDDTENFQEELQLSGPIPDQDRDLENVLGGFVPATHVGTALGNEVASLNPLPQDTQETAIKTNATSPMADSVKVYSFPMKPFQVINVHPIHDTSSFSDTKFSDIARMTRTLDQLDRNLISASSKYIAYSMSKTKGGVRVIRQEDGQDIVLMKENSDKVVHVIMGNADRVMATGSSGAVLWAELQNGDFDTGHAHSSFIFPPSDLQDQNGGLTKSRAHKSSRHNDVFAIGRGKHIHLVDARAAQTFVKPQSNEVDEKRYLAKYNRVIDTGKVSKDFCFSEDDTAILSVDKAGKIKLWDIEKLVNFDSVLEGNGSHSIPVLTEPSTVFNAAGSGESYKATSVMFLDKLRPYQKGLALRYILVGLKQNHVLQLWDLAIGKPVQEVRFPQESQTDALCSVAYHPQTGMIVVGNPTRNAIYFIHLSAPRYNLPTLTQTEYAKAIAAKSPILPRLDATAIMSGMREYSFGDKGQLISLDILDVVPMSDEIAMDGEESSLFELYIAHTKGMTCLTIMKEDLGWDKDCKSKNAIDAVASGICTFTPLAPPPPSDETVPKEAVQIQPMATTAVVEASPVITNTEVPKAELEPLNPLRPQPVSPQPPAATLADRKRNATTSGSAGASEMVVERNESKSSSETGKGKKVAVPPMAKGNGKKGKRDFLANNGPLTPSLPPLEQAPASSPLKKKERTREKEKLKEEAKPSTTISLTPEVLNNEIKKFEAAVSAEFTKALDHEVSSLYQRLDDDKRIQQASGDAKQEAVLRMISSTLVSGMEQVLAKIVLHDIETKVVPEVNNTITKSLQSIVPTTVNTQISASLPDAVKRTMLSKEMQQQLSMVIGDVVKKEVDKSVKAVLVPALDKMTIESSRLISNEVNKKTREALKESRKTTEADSVRIAQLTSAISDMTTGFSVMEQTIVKLIDRVNELSVLQQQPQPTAAATQPPPKQEPEVKQLTPEQQEMQKVEQLLHDQNFEAGILTWLQSKERQDTIFDNIIHKFAPGPIIPQLSVIVVLTVAASVTGSLENHAEKRLDWLEIALADLSQLSDDDQVHQEMMPRILGVIISRLQHYFMIFSEEFPGLPLLKRIQACHRKAKTMLAKLTGSTYGLAPFTP